MSLRVWKSALGLLTFAALLLSGCGESVESKSAATGQSDLSGVTLVLGDQAKGLRTVVEAANALEGIEYKVEWANFQGAAPMFEALRAGAVDLGPAGDMPALAAATGGTPLHIVAVRRSQSRSIAILVPADSAIRSVADFKGRVVVSSARGSISQYLLIRALANAGVDERDVNVGFACRPTPWRRSTPPRSRPGPRSASIRPSPSAGCTGVDQRRGHQQRTDVHYRLG
jgi:ABC-type nitrate/sulfonate/bicarbonate transport system substrate-binding protein